jgi:hypothetical protein
MGAKFKKGQESLPAPMGIFGKGPQPQRGMVIED